MPMLINVCHIAFVKGRSINDNTFLARNLVKHYERSETSPRVMMKIDVRKAYDIVN